MAVTITSIWFCDTLSKMLNFIDHTNNGLWKTLREKKCLSVMGKWITIYQAALSLYNILLGGCDFIKNVNKKYKRDKPFLNTCAPVSNLEN